MPSPALLGTIMFALLVGTVLVRSRVLARHGVKAIVFGRTDKSDFLLVPAVMLVVYSVLAATFGWPLWSPLRRSLWHSGVLAWTGVALNVLALAGMVWTLIGFGASFRVGIDESHPGGLVTTGAFGVSRNPIYVCFFIFLAGLCLIFASPLILAAAVGFAFLVNRQVRREEKYLLEHYGTPYQDYCRRVRRYL